MRKIQRLFGKFPGNFYIAAKVHAVLALFPSGTHATVRHALRAAGGRGGAHAFQSSLKTQVQRVGHLKILQRFRFPRIATSREISWPASHGRFPIDGGDTNLA